MSIVEDKELVDDDVQNVFVEKKGNLLDETEFTFFQSKYFWTFVLFCTAGVVYGITFAFKNMQIKFSLYCSCVWLVCLALICLANYRSDQTTSASSPTSA